MQTLESRLVDSDEVATLSQMTETLPEQSALRDFLTEVVNAVHAGGDITVVSQEQQVSPAIAAKMLGVSRVHVYKLMDRGDLPFVRVGNDRRTTLAHIEAFKESQSSFRADMARRAAHPGKTRIAAQAAL